MGLALDEPNETDQTLPMNGLSVVVEHNLLPFLEDQVVDLVSTPQGQGLTINRSGMQAC